MMNRKVLGSTIAICLGIGIAAYLSPTSTLAGAEGGHKESGSGHQKDDKKGKGKGTESAAGSNHGHDEKDEHGTERVEMHNEAIKKAGIELQRAGSVKLSNIVPLPAEIRFNQDQTAEVTPRLAGVVVSVHKNLGDRVRKGELLATLESQMLAEWRSDYLAAQKRLELARSNFEREKRLWDDKITAEQDLLLAKKEVAEADIARQAAADRISSIGAVLPTQPRNLARFELRAPLSGTVVEKHITPGEAVKEDATLFQVTDLSTVWAEIAVYPKNISQIRQGQKVSVSAAELGSQTVGTVSYIGAQVGQQTRTAMARVTLSNPDGKWRPGLFVTVGVLEGDVTVGVAVKSVALQTVEGRQVVFVREGDSFEARPVELGRKDGQWVEVVKGLRAGDVYAANNSFIVKSELGKAGAEHEH